MARKNPRENPLVNGHDSLGAREHDRRRPRVVLNIADNAVTLTSSAALAPTATAAQ